MEVLQVEAPFSFHQLSMQQLEIVPSVAMIEMTLDL